MFILHLQYTHMHTDYSNQPQAGTSSAHSLCPIVQRSTKIRSGVQEASRFQTLTLSHETGRCMLGAYFKYCLKTDTENIQTNNNKKKQGKTHTHTQSTKSVDNGNLTGFCERIPVLPQANNDRKYEQKGDTEDSTVFGWDGVG